MSNLSCFSLGFFLSNFPYENQTDPTQVAPNVESYLQTPGHSHRLTFIQQQKAISKVESKWCHD